MKDRTFIHTIILAATLCWLAAGTASAQTQPTDNPAEVYTWRYVKETVKDQEIIQRKKMTWDEGQTWDKEQMDTIKQDISQGKVTGVPPGADPTAIATWKLYYDQLVLWQDYLKQTIFVATDLQTKVEDLKWVPGGGTEGGQEGLQGLTGAEAVVAANQNKSLDDQTASFFTVGGGGQQGQNAPVVTREDILKQVIALYEMLLNEGKSADEETYKAAQAINSGLTEREGKRLAYRNWLDDRKEMVVETAEDWGKRQQGQVVVVNGVQYELYSPSLGMPKGAGAADVVRVVTDNLTPYDLLNADGTQKQPAER